MTREEALAILELPRAQAEVALLGLWEKAERWERLQSQGASEASHVPPTTPSGMTPVYLKPRARRPRKRPGRKKGHAAPRPVSIRGANTGSRAAPSVVKRWGRLFAPIVGSSKTSPP